MVSPEINAVCTILIAVFVYMMNAQGGIPLPVIIMLIVSIAGAFLTQSTTFGRYLYAIGSNPDAARLSGINSRKHILMAYLTPDQAVVGNELAVQYMGERYPVTVAVVGSTPLFDPENTRIRS